MEAAQRESSANLGRSPSYYAKFQNNQFMNTPDELLERALSANAGNAINDLRMIKGMPARLKADAAK